MNSTTRWTLLLLAGGMLLLAALFQLPDATHVSFLGWTLPEICLWRRMFDMNCPGCGLTRACVAAVHGQPTLSFRFHPLGMPLVALAAGTASYQAFQLARNALAKDVRSNA